MSRRWKPGLGALIIAAAGALSALGASVQLAATREQVIVRGIRGSTLVVHVTGGRRPLARAEVRIEYADPATTDEDGIARFPGRWPAAFTVSAVAPQYA